LVYNEKKAAARRRDWGKAIIKEAEREKG